jgi:hypothetical protein
MPHEWRRLMKMSALYAQWFGARVFSGSGRITRTGEEILGLTLARVEEGRDGYVFRDGDILFFHYICRCCRRTVLALREDGESGPAQGAPPIEDDDDTPAELMETAALAFLQRRHSADRFLSFVKDKKLKGKLRAYATGFVKYGEEAWDIERIARDLRVTPATVGKYRSQLRELLEEFELQRMRRGPV